ncbi:MAG: urease accessory protein UreF [Gammaproteobacteria bacterium]|nr:urease accessory protein UreF [Gammaproteobacteria bacterium]
MSETPDLRLLRVLQLTSPSLPVGAYAYSQGLEWAVEAGWVHDAATLAQWLRAQLNHNLPNLDLPVLGRLHQAASADDNPALHHWSRILVASRETSELVADDCNRGRALARLLAELDLNAAGPWVKQPDCPFATPMALAAAAWEMPLATTALAYCWGWLENQVLAGVKLIPLGQVVGQRLLLDLAEQIPGVCADGLGRPDQDIGGTLPLLAIASSLHETQYSRLFRS